MVITIYVETYAFASFGLFVTMVVFSEVACSLVRVSAIPKIAALTPSRNLGKISKNNDDVFCSRIVTIRAILGYFGSFQILFRKLPKTWMLNDNWSENAVANY